MENNESNLMEKNFSTTLANAACQEGVLPQESLDLSDENLNFIHQMANQMYEQSQFQKAEDLFRLLCTLKPNEQSYWFGLGATQQMRSKYAQAIFSYKFASSLKIEDPESAFHAAECHLKLGQAAEAQIALEIAFTWAKHNPQYSHVAQKAEQLLNKTH